MELTRRAYAFFDVKEVNEEKRVIRGVATTPTVDRVGDIVEPLGVKFQNPLPFLWQHRHGEPIGTVIFDKPTKEGITFTAELPMIEEAGTLKNRVDEAWQSMKLKLVRAVSIGFRAIEYSWMDDTGGIRFIQTEVYELSAVTIPAQADAVITSLGKSMKAALPGRPIDAAALAVIKQFDIGAPAPEDSDENDNPDPAATGKTVRVVKLVDPARDRAKPFVIREIKRLA